ncbi:MAG: hypothetical protein ACLPY1_21490 [Terracidiphilus sp.]
MSGLRKIAAILVADVALAETYRCPRCGKNRQSCPEVPGCHNEYRQRKRAEHGAKPRPNRRYAAAHYEPDDEARIAELIAEGKTDDVIGAALGRAPGAIACFRFREQIPIPDEHKSAHIKTGLLAVGLGATDQEKTIIEDRYPTQMSGELLKQLPGRNEKWIRNQARAQMVGSSNQKRKRIGQKAQERFDHDTRLRLPAETSIDDLSYTLKKIIRGSLLGDGGVYRRKEKEITDKNGRVYQHRSRYHFFQETHGLAQALYVDWIFSFFPKELVGRNRPRLSEHFYPDSEKMHKKYGFRTRSHPMFTRVSDIYDMHSNGDNGDPGKRHNSGMVNPKSLHYKCRIPDWLIDTFDEIDLFFWYLGDGSANVSGGRPYPNISAPRWRGDDLGRFCKLVNARHGWHLGVYEWINRQPENGKKQIEVAIKIPPEDVEKLWPIWRKFAADYKLTDCMWYKLPRYDQATFGGKTGRGKRWEDMVVEGVNGAKTIVPDQLKLKLVAEITEMKQFGATRAEMSAYLSSKGHYLSKEAITRLIRRV